MRKAVGWFLVWLVAASAFAGQAEPPTDLEVLTKALARPLVALQGRLPEVTATFAARYRDGEREETGELTIARADGRFGLGLRCRLVSLSLVRDGEALRLVIPSKQVAIVGEGPAPARSAMEPGRLFTNSVAVLPPQWQAILGLLLTAETGVVVPLLQPFMQLERVPAQDGQPPTFVARKPVAKGTLSVLLTADGGCIQELRWRNKAVEATVKVALRDEALLPEAPTDGLKVLRVPRAELEEMLGRGLARALDILQYNEKGTLPADGERTAGRGRLVVKEGQRLVTLQGSAYEVGFQHGRLLKHEMRRLMDSVLCVVGMAYSVEQREWFPDVMRGAWKRLLPHIPKEYLEEMKGVADGADLALERVQLGNVFPALFHCSGFALMGRATKDGKLYHGRVLDYMTEVGLQREAAVFVVRKDGAIPFANVSYAGFIGSVSGMNAQRVALGEMGGGGEGLWDGTPMPILMRMGLERARTLDDACRIFREAKRTCEYYYVFSDGKIPDAVGVGATPDEIEFVKPGEAHPLLPTPVEDCVLLSADDRYEHLVAKTKAKFGQFGVEAALDLMRRPVAMRSNLHDVLFVPQDLVLYVANARGSRPACDQPYTRYDLRAILARMATLPKTE